MILKKATRRYFSSPRFPDVPHREWKTRITTVQEQMTDNGVDCLVLWQKENLRYFFGFMKIHWYLKSLQPAVGIIPVKGEPILIVPELATSWEMAPDFKSCVFRLRKGVKFHDGTPFNAEAGKVFFERMIVPEIVALVLLYLSAKFDQFWLVPVAFGAGLLIYIVPGVIEGFRGYSKD